MALTNVYVQAITRIPDIFAKIRDGQAPERFSQQLLKDWGFTSTNDRTFVPLLKALGFLSADGKPMQRYKDYRDHSRSKEVMGDALKEAYGDIFMIKEHPTASDKSAIEGKFKSFHNASDNVAGLMTKTFLGLLPLADFKAKETTKVKVPNLPNTEIDHKAIPPISPTIHQAPGLHYNIQIHLPATKDVEVYNAIFKSLREHLLGN
jgi:hypothetical protein